MFYRENNVFRLFLLLTFYSHPVFVPKFVFNLYDWHLLYPPFFPFRLSKSCKRVNLAHKKKKNSFGQNVLKQISLFTLFILIHKKESERERERGRERERLMLTQNPPDPESIHFHSSFILLPVLHFTHDKISWKIFVILCSCCSFMSLEFGPFIFFLFTCILLSLPKSSPFSVKRSSILFTVLLVFSLFFSSHIFHPLNQ